MNRLYSVYFTDINTGYAVGDYGTILKTINGGTDWTALSSGTTYQLNSVFFTDINTGYAVGVNGTILKTTNAGEPPPTLTVTPSSKSVSTVAGATQFIVISNTNWVVTSDAPWCTMTLSGSGNDNIFTTFTENDILTERIAHITVTTSGISPVTVTITQAGRPYRQLNLTLFLEVFFDTSTSAMRQSQDSDAEFNTWPKFEGSTVDTLSVLLAKATSPWNLLYQSHGLNIDSNGTVAVNIPLSYSGTYYIVIKHRNSIETWSSVPVSFATNNINYNFSTAYSQAYGDNLLEINGIYMTYTGGINQDGLVDLDDLILVEADVNDHSFGYLITDVNGDGIVDLSDLILVEKNASLFIHVCHP